MHGRSAGSRGEYHVEQLGARLVSRPVILKFIDENVWHRRSALEVTRATPGQRTLWKKTSPSSFDHPTISVPWVLDLNRAHHRSGRMPAPARTSGSTPAPSQPSQVT